MTYVPVKLWVPDEADEEGTTPMVSEILLKLCDVCHAPIPQQFMDDHVTKQHPEPPPPGSPEQPIAPPPVGPEQH